MSDGSTIASAVSIGVKRPYSAVQDVSNLEAEIGDLRAEIGDLRAQAGELKAQERELLAQEGELRSEAAALQLIARGQAVPPHLESWSRNYQGAPQDFLWQLIVDKHQQITAKMQQLTAIGEQILAMEQQVTARHQQITARHQQITARHQQITARHQQITAIQEVYDQVEEHQLARLAESRADPDGSKLMAYLENALHPTGEPHWSQPYLPEALDGNIEYRGRKSFTKVVRQELDDMNPQQPHHTLALVFFVARGCGKTRAVLQLASTLNPPLQEGAAVCADTPPPTRVIYIEIDGTESALMHSSAYVSRIICRHVLAVLMGPYEISAVGALMVPRPQHVLHDAPLPPLEVLYHEIAKYLNNNGVKRLVIAVDRIHHLHTVRSAEGPPGVTTPGSRAVLRALRHLQRYLFTLGIKALPIGLGVHPAGAFEPDPTMGKVKIILESGADDDDSTLLSMEDYTAVWTSCYRNRDSRATFDPLKVAYYWPRVREILLPHRLLLGNDNDMPFDQIIMDTWCKRPVKLSGVPEGLVVKPLPGSRHDDLEVQVVLDGLAMDCIVCELVKRKRCSRNIQFLDDQLLHRVTSHATRKQLYGFWSLLLISEVLWGLKLDSRWNFQSKLRGYTVPPSLKACIEKVRNNNDPRSPVFFERIHPQAATAMRPHRLPYTSPEENELNDDFIQYVTRRQCAALHYGDGSNTGLDAIFLFPTDDLTADGRPVTLLLAVEFKTSAMDVEVVANKVLLNVTKLAAACNQAVTSVHVAFDWFVITCDEKPANSPNCYGLDGYYVPPFTTLLFTPTGP